MHYAHILKGAYIAPEIALRYMSFETYSYNYDNNYYRETQYREENFSLAIMLKLGKQWIFDDSFLVDIYGGIGYGFGGFDYDALTYGFLVGSGDVPIAASAGIRIGWVFGRK